MVRIRLGHAMARVARGDIQGPTMNRDLTSEDSSTATAAQPEGAGVRRAYRKPELISYGRVEDMTRAGKKSGKEASKKPRSLG